VTTAYYLELNMAKQQHQQAQEVQTALSGKLTTL
jgi:hypothetical protein